VTCVQGFEQTLKNELSTIIPEAVITLCSSGVEFTPSTPSPVPAYKVLLYSRVAIRVMELIASSDQDNPLSSSADLHNFVYKNVDAVKLLSNNDSLLSLSVRCTLPTNRNRIPKSLAHSHFSALSVKNALVDKFRDSNPNDPETRPSVELLDTDVPLTLAISANDMNDSCNARLFRSLSSTSLHKRGYRSNLPIHKAALKETVAAGLLLEAGFHLLVADSKSTNAPCALLDPFTGSATFLIEAAMICADVAPFLLREKSNEITPRFLKWDGAYTDSWNQLYAEAKMKSQAGRRYLSLRKDQFILSGTDNISSDLARQTVAKAGFSESIDIENCAFEDWHCEDLVVEDRTIICCNPPWNIRLREVNPDDEENHERMFASLGVWLKSINKRVECWNLHPPSSAYGAMKLAKSRSFTFSTSNLKLRWLQYNLR